VIDYLKPVAGELGNQIDVGNSYLDLCSAVHANSQAVAAQALLEQQGISGAAGEVGK
jgi:hypothetical protein